MGELVPVPQQTGGGSSGGAIVEFEYGSATDLRKKLADMKQKLNLTREFFQQVMQEGIDYGKIPGTDKPTLLKPGAEALCEFYNFAPTIADKVEDKNFETGYYSVDITIRLVHRSTGTIVGEGVGHANTFENRYRWRWVGDRDVPRGMSKEDLVSKEFNGSNGKYYKYRVENEDMHSIWNTVLKMAKKRALVDAVLAATRSSGIFTQSEEELEAYLNGNDPEVDWEGTPPPRQQRSSSSTQGNQSSKGNPQSNGGRSGGNSEKSRAYELTKQVAGSMDWNWLTERASEALGRTIKKVVQDVAENEWKAVADYLQHYYAEGSDDKPPLDFNNLPEDLR